MTHPSGSNCEHHLQEEHKAEHKAAKAAAANLSVADKTTFASRQQALFTGDAIKAGFQETVRAEEVCGSRGWHVDKAIQTWLQHSCIAYMPIWAVAECKGCTSSNTHGAV